MTDQTRGNLCIPEVQTFFPGLHLKTRGKQAIVIYESDRTRGYLRVTETKMAVRLSMFKI